MNRNAAIGILLAVTFVAGIAVYFFRAAPQDEPSPVAESTENSATVADTAPGAEGIINFSLDDIDGNKRQLSEWQGKARLVNFWATWCAPCRREIPLLKKTQEIHAVDNVQIIGIAVDFRDAVIAYAEDAQFNYPILVGQEDAMAAAESSGVDLIGLPFTLVIAPTGELLKAHIGEIVEAHIDKIIEVFTAMESGRMDIAGAREALAEL
jgi:thiol-disulfide isomerase/thioredoxin